MSLSRDWRIYFSITTALIIVLLLWSTIAPFSFPKGKIVTVEEGESLYTLAENLEEEHVIRSPFWFRIFAIILGGERGMRAGDYLMAERQSVFTIAWRVLYGKHGIETVKMTIPEGFNVEKISSLFDEKFPDFSHAEFKKLAPEGYLFPDTYFIPVTATASSTIKLMQDNFLRQTSSTLSQIDKLDFS